jgi:hypothetical protein
MNYFNNTMSNDEAKAIYRKLAVQLHPDKSTGSHELFVDLNNQEGTFLKGNGTSEEWAKAETAGMDAFIKANEFIKAFAGVTIELTGSWVWLAGNTFPYKEQIKEAGFAFSASKKKWYLAPYKISGKRKGTSFSKIKNKYGYEAVTIQDTTAKLY